MQARALPNPIDSSFFTLPLTGGCWQGVVAKNTVVPPRRGLVVPANLIHRSSKPIWTAQSTRDAIRLKCRVKVET